MELPQLGHAGIVSTSSEKDACIRIGYVLEVMIVEEILVL